MTDRSLLRVSLWLAAVLIVPVVLRSAEPPQFDEPLEIFQPRQAASEAEQDRAQALVYYGMAREAEGRNEFQQAMRWYQRTLRYDPSCEPAARSVVRLALRLKRPDWAIDAALKISECKKNDRLPLRYMAIYLSQQGRWKDAIELYEGCLGVRPHEPAVEEDIQLMMEMGRLCYLVEDHQKAAAYFKEVLKALEAPREHHLSPKVRRELLGKEAETYQSIGDCLLLAGDVEAAKSAFQKAEEASPDAARTAFNAAAIEKHSGRLEEALQKLDTYFENPGGDLGIAPYALLEEILNQLGRGDELLTRLAALRDKRPNDDKLGYLLAEKWFEAKQYDRAEPLYTALSAKAPTSTAYQRLVEIAMARADCEKVADVLAAVVEKTGSLDALGEGLEKVVVSDDAVAAVLARGEQAAKGATGAKGATKAEQSSGLAAALLALRAERFDAAEPLMNAAISAMPDNALNLLLAWGVDLLDADRFKDATDVFRQGAEREGASKELRAVFEYYLAAALELDGQTEAALEAARKAVELQEDSAPFHARVAWVLFHADRKAESIAEYRALIDRFDDDSESEQSCQAVRQARMVLSSLCASEGRVKDAVEWLEQVLDEYPENPGALNDLGYLWADENQHLDRAYRMVQQAVESDPENGAYRDSLGWVLYRKGQYDEAVSELEKAVEKEPDPVVLDHLGDAYWKANQQEKARTTWDRAAGELEADGKYDEAAEIREKITGAK